MKRRIISLFLLPIVAFLSFHSTAVAITPQQKELLNGGVQYFDYERCDPTSGSSLSGSNAASGASNGYPIRVPVIKDPQKLADAINQFIKKSAPNAPLNGKGAYFVQGGMRAGINPILVAVQARNESGFGQKIPGGSFNSFGRTATDSQPNVSVNGRLWYRWGSWEKSLVADAFPASGKSDQPDDQFQYIARRYAGNLDSGLESFLGGGNGVPAYAPASENDLPRYVKNVVDWTNEIVTLAGGAVDMSQIGGATTSSSPTSTTPTTASKKVVAIDPGHGGAVPEYTDPVTKLGDRETPNTPEREDMQDVANQAKTELEKSGYTVVLLKSKADEVISKRERVDAAKAANANLGISLHSDSSKGGFEKWAEVWPQFVGGYRQSASNPSIKVTFSNQEVANLSNSYSDIFKEERDKAERGGSGVTQKVVGQSDSFGKARGLPSYGDLSLIQLWADNIPWVYNEVGAPAGGMTTDQKAKYAAGIVNAVKRALPASADVAGNGCAPGTGGALGNGDAVSTALNYAWPDYRGSGYIQMKPEYAAAIKTAQSAGMYIGGVSHPGIDCGGFVTRVMIDSGFAPGYNNGGLVKNGAGFTGIQLSWAKANWQLIGRGNAISTAQLQPGDVAFRVDSAGGNDGHTFMYVGTQPNFGDDIASASLDDRAPMAGKENPLASNIMWFRKK